MNNNSILTSKNHENQNSHCKSFNVVGIEFDNNDGTSRLEIIKRLDRCELVTLKEEPENTHDTNAISVHSCIGIIGYVPRNMTEVIRPFIKNTKIIFTATIIEHKNSFLIRVDATNKINQKNNENFQDIQFIAKVCGVCKEDKYFSKYLDKDSDFEGKLDFNTKIIEIEHIKEYHDINSMIESLGNNTLGYISKENSKKVFDLYSNIGKYNKNVKENERLAFSLTVEFYKIIENQFSNEELYVEVVLKIISIDEMKLLQQEDNQ